MRQRRPKVPDVPLLMTPGPTQVRENVRIIRAFEMTNPDQDLKFFKFYRKTCLKLAAFLNTEAQVLILSGEGMVALDAACASLTESGDRVLILDNGIFGEGFADMVKVYGAEPVVFKGDRTRGISAENLREFLEKDSDFKFATIVHCDTPSGVLNDLKEICPLLKSYGILTVVDAVSSMVGEPILTDDWNIDICIGASQKGFSAPPGLAFLSISPDAWTVIKGRKTPIPSFYCNLLLWKNYYEDLWFPYTPPISDIYAFKTALDNVLKEDDASKRHRKIAKAVRKAVIRSGLSLYLKSDYCSTVTAINVPEGLDGEEIVQKMKAEHSILIGGNFGYLKGKVIRLGHMGENARLEYVSETLKALQLTLESEGVSLRADMESVFLEEMAKKKR
ncbi:pyridoxal-phosphate-dependent aminotransferase family protein [Methanimicrococcus blatticola]|uniref:Aspartate aminotransferase-like enzyme n=1 Tax=Methanimicrococcus blatticola TaxID=91560 RepID=A0A484F702_9EURY|nr:alanine--glyoxylate aminotransferase family protein [Methanimicrococcus blatticola]MBZ3935172.1 alanine--glyoxylate aminotransferase family protein [Methanimicrococcus blatticola]MCC2508731.1 alanine--glyoxylate aminotransferase family protein [Methanimicrococcus blatticola]TDQ71233.1 aspartate aminotransferase-like enzyme [Methanimicrococcus blatticola]